MKFIDLKPYEKIIASDFDTICEMTGEYGDESWNDEDIEMLMEKHGLTGKEVAAILTEIAFALRHINLAVVKGADKGTHEVLSRCSASADDRYMSELRSYIWDGIRQGIRKSLVDCLKHDPAAFMAAIINANA